MESLTFVDLATARAARGLRLAVISTLPSPWSESAKELLRLRRVPAQVVRLRRGDDDLLSWTGARNAPVALFDDEPPRTGWAEILALADRLGDLATPPLCPSDPERRVRLLGLAQELVGEDGLAWSARLLMIDGSLTSEGQRSFPLGVARYLAPRYGYTPERVAAARARLLALLALFDRQLADSRAAGHRYLLGDEVTALDVYLATCLTPVAGLGQADCPGIQPELRRAFGYLREDPGLQIPPAILAHRDLMFRDHLRSPIEL